MSNFEKIFNAASVKGVRGADFVNAEQVRLNALFYNLFGGCFINGIVNNNFVIVDFVDFAVIKGKTGVANNAFGKCAGDVFGFQWKIPFLKIVFGFGYP